METASSNLDRNPVLKSNNNLDKNEKIAKNRGR